MNRPFSSLIKIDEHFWKLDSTCEPVVSHFPVATGERLKQYSVEGQSRKKKTSVSYMCHTYE